MYHEKMMLKKWKAELQDMKEEKRNEIINEKHNIPDNTAKFMTGKNMYYKKNGVWKQK